MNSSSARFLGTWRIFLFAGLLLVWAGLSAFGADEPEKKKTGMEKVQEKISENAKQSTTDWMLEKAGDGFGYIFRGGVYIKEKADAAIEYIKNPRVPFVDDINDKMNARNETARKRVVYASSRAGEATREELFQQMKRDRPGLVGAYANDDNGAQFWYDMKNNPKKFDENVGRQMADIDDYCKVADAGGYSSDTTTRQEDHLQDQRNMGEVAVENVVKGHTAAMNSQDISGAGQEAVETLQGTADDAQTAVEVGQELLAGGKDKPEKKEKTDQTEQKPRAETEVKPDDEAKSAGNEVETETSETKPDENAGTPDSSTRRRDRAPQKDRETLPDTEEQPADEPEAEPKPSRPEAGDEVTASDGSTTITKGWVEGADGNRITLTETRNPDGSVITTATETDKDGKILSQTTYGESGEGHTTRPNNGLRDAEAGSDADVDAETASGGVNTSGDYSDIWSDQQDRRSTESTDLMAQNSQMDESANVGNDEIRQAKNTRNRAGRDATATADSARRKTLKNDRANSWGKAIGDGIESGITEGGEAFGAAFGGAAADVAVGEIFGHSDEDSSDISAAATETASAAASTTASDSSTSSRTTPKSNPGNSSTASNSDRNQTATPSNASSGESGNTSNSGSRSGSAGAHGHCPICGRTDLVEYTYETDNMIVHDWRCPVCNVSGVAGPPPEGLGDSSESSSEDTDAVSGGNADDDSDDTSAVPCSGTSCGRCGYCPCRREPPGPDDDHIVCWFVCPKCGWRISMSDGSGL